MAAPPMLLAFAIAVIVIAMWAGWVVRTGRGGSHVRALPVVVVLAIAVLEALAIHAMRAPLGDPASKAQQLAEHISRGMRYFAGAWGAVIAAVIALAALSLRAARDPDAPSARVVREPRRDR